VVADAVIRNNIILNSAISGITAAPHAANRRVRNVSIINNTIVGHAKCLYIRWHNAENMVLANNAVYCPGGDAVDAEIAQVKGQTFRANYLEGRLLGVRLNPLQFISGGAVAAAFMNPDKFDLWPRVTSPLIRKGHGALAPQLDFNQNPRNPRAVDVGAYETRGWKSNPGWQIVPGFKKKNP
jgi:hypothetical protein